MLLNFESSDESQERDGKADHIDHEGKTLVDMEPRLFEIEAEVSLSNEANVLPSIDNLA